MATISRLTTWNTGDVLTAAALNAEFNNIVNDYNGGITNANISASAAIAYSKLNLTSSIVNADISNSASIAYSKLNLGSSIVNADISASANIEATKISGTAATLSGAETLANKILTKPTVNGSIGTYTSNVDGTTVTFDMAASNYQTVTIAGNRTFAVSNVSVGQSFAIEVVQDATGSRLATWFSGIKWPGGAPPTLTTTANKRDVFVFKCIASNSYVGLIGGQNIS